MTERICSKCNNTYPYTKEFFYLYKRKKTGKVRHTRICKNCRRDQIVGNSRERYRNNPEYREKTLKNTREKYRDNEYHRKYMNQLNDKFREKYGVSYGGIHNYIRYHKIKEIICSKCNKEGYTELHCLEHKYTRALEQWIYVCKTCHRKLNNLIILI